MRGIEREKEDRQITACSCTSLLSSCFHSMSCDKMWFIAFTETNGHRHVGLSMACVWGSSNMCLCGLVGQPHVPVFASSWTCFRRELVYLCVCLSICWCWWTFTPVYFWDGSSFKSQSSGSRQIAVENIEHYLSHYNPQLSKPLQHSHLLLAISIFFTL